jgi:anti-sigma-K factor RskA
MSDGAQLLLTREPLGGKPADQDAGPVVAEGSLQLI